MGDAGLVSDRLLVLLSYTAVSKTVILPWVRHLTLSCDCSRVPYGLQSP